MKKRANLIVSLVFSAPLNYAKPKIYTRNEAIRGKENVEYLV